MTCHTPARATRDATVTATTSTSNCKPSNSVILSKSMELLFRAVPPSLYLALAMTEPQEKAARHRLMQQHGISELDAAIRMAQDIDRARGIEPFNLELSGATPCANG